MTRPDCIDLGYFRYMHSKVNISNIYNPDENTSLESQTICDHMFSDPKLDHTFHVFWLHTWLKYFLLVYENCTLTSKMERFWNIM